MATAAKAQNSWESIKPLVCLPLVEGLEVEGAEEEEGMELVELCM